MRLILTILAFLVAATLLFSSDVRAQEAVESGDLTRPQGDRAKGDQGLNGLLDEYQAYQDQGGGDSFDSDNAVFSAKNGWLVIDAVASGDASSLQADLENLGMQRGAA
ncbi:MAG: hypothetical protein ACE5Q6_03375, partial [Dehalococcoidia bacterium]